MIDQEMVEMILKKPTDIVNIVITMVILGILLGDASQCQESKKA